MTQQQIQQTMDFILRSQVDSVVRMEKWEERQQKFDEKFEARHVKIQRELASLAVDIRALERSQRSHERAYEKSQRAYEKRMRAVEASDRRTRRRVESIKDLMRLFNKRVDTHSQRLGRIERNGR